MKCSNKNTNWFEFLEGKMEQPLANELNQHLTACEDCKKEHEQAKATLTLIREQKLTQASSDMEHKVLTALKNEPKSKTKTLNAVSTFQRIAAVLIIAFGLMLGVIVGTQLYKPTAIVANNSENVWTEEFYINSTNNLADLETELYSNNKAQ